MPRIDTVSTQVFKFDELSPKAQEKAREKYREGHLDYDWWDSVYEAANTAAKILGISIGTKGKNTPCIWFSGFSSQGDGACFEGTYSYAKGWRKKIEAEFGEGETRDKLISIGLSLQQAQRPQLFQLEAVCSHRGHYNHSGCMRVEVSHKESMYRDIGDAEDGITEALREFADWIYSSLEAEHDWLLDDEQIDESIEANECEFREDGTRYF